MAVQRPPAFLGRSGERDVLDRLLETARGGQSAVLLIRGEAGFKRAVVLFGGLAALFLIVPSAQATHPRPNGTTPMLP